MATQLAVYLDGNLEQVFLCQFRVESRPRLPEDRARMAQRFPEVLCRIRSKRGQQQGDIVDRCLRERRPTARLPIRARSFISSISDAIDVLKCQRLSKSFVIFWIV